MCSNLPYLWGVFHQKENMATSSSIWQRLQAPRSIAPLVVYRVLFGLLVGYGCVWSWLKGDPQIRFLEPTFYFKYYGLEWLPEPSAPLLYGLYGLWAIASVGIVLGAYYRWAIWTFFGVFTYLHLIDATNYINHYYAISIFAGLLGLSPAHRAASIDGWRKPDYTQSHAPILYVGALRLQVALIYGFAALAKCGPDWLERAMPLRIWLLQRSDFPLLGEWFSYWEAALVASWVGLLFDATIVGWLSFRKTRPWAYLGVWVFHGLTGLLFNIGLFPWVMITATVVFFSGKQQEQWLQRLGLGLKASTSTYHKAPTWIMGLLGLHFLVQLLLPLRHQVLYTGNPLWTEEGYRFSWWVMLVEKEGMATFTVSDPATGRQWEVDNRQHLTPFQEKRMSVRPDHILQYAHYLADFYQKKHQIAAPEVRATVHVTLNGRLSQPLVDPAVNLAAEPRHWRQKTWVLPFEA